MRKDSSTALKSRKVLTAMPDKIQLEILNEYGDVKISFLSLFSQIITSDYTHLHFCSLRIFIALYAAFALSVNLRVFTHDGTDT